MKSSELINKYWLLAALMTLLILSFTVCSNNKETTEKMKTNQMIVDSMENADKYCDMHPLFEKAFTILKEKDLDTLSVGRHDVDGDRLFFSISKGPGRKRSESRLEAHRKYIDIQYVISGTDEMGWKPASECKIIDTAYDADRDVEYYKDKPQIWNKVVAGSFAVFFPQDAHAPLVSEGEIHKVVFKIAVE